MGTTTKLLTLGAAGAAGWYFLDPDQGARRRNEARDRALSLLGRGGQEADSDYADGQASDQPKPELTDQALARKVESIIFRDADAPKGNIDVDAAGATVWLRGEVESQDQIDELVRRTYEIPEVVGVENLLHTAGTPAPTRADTPESERRDTSYAETESPVEARAGMSSDEVREAEGDQKEA